MCEAKGFWTTKLVQCDACDIEVKRQPPIKHEGGRDRGNNQF